MTGLAVLALMPAAGLVAGAFGWLRGAGIPTGAAILIMLFAALQAGPVLAVAGEGHSLWLALALGGVTASAAAFAEREDARRVILFGSALAAIQLADPLGGMLAAGLVPVAVAMHAGTEPRRTAGLYALLLFLPLATGVILFYAARNLDITTLQLFSGARFSPRDPSLVFRFAIALSPALVALPALLVARKGAGGRAVGLVAAVTAVSASLAAAVGVIREPVTLLAAAMPRSIGALACLPDTPSRARSALALSASCTGLSWLMFAAIG